MFVVSIHCFFLFLFKIYIFFLSFCIWNISSIWRQVAGSGINRVAVTPFLIETPGTRPKAIISGPGCVSILSRGYRNPPGALAYLKKKWLRGLHFFTGGWVLIPILTQFQAMTSIWNLQFSFYHNHFIWINRLWIEMENKKQKKEHIEST